ncbi:hypothetical protein GGTG_03285 [Gaeumannomyces tritici R3-111a-1]|uniref:Rhodopsin domain-containing protein n=1 Tax=Gaeumannomyces tritici (strain R3-111a-1) TaxID=644352 RepID=J3NPS8_GAET3|nr:hypothetical protein GGTG_03285 [Gaeumannomyces tritici R3-111a-1]EJT78183.1 hypothetical protein GGTG_03285 [Gaeumannomyces tritici R3-111a-1]
MSSEMEFDRTKNPELFSSETRRGEIIAVNVTLLAFVTIIVALRFYTRTVILHTLGLDDWLVLLSLIILAALVSNEFVLESRGLGHHIGTLPIGGFKEYLKAFYVSIQLYNLAIATIKFAFLAQYHRIMTVQSMRRDVRIVSTIVGCWSVSQIIVGLVPCNPISGFWELTEDTVCLPELPTWYANAIGNIIADIMIIVLPLPMIRRLKLPRTQKLVLGGIFCLGFFTCGISASRIRFLGNPVDTTWENLDAEFWSLAEICSGIVCAVLPTLRPLAGRCFPRYFGSRSNRSYFLSQATDATWQQKSFGGTGGFGGGDRKPSAAARASRRAPDHDDEEMMWPHTEESKPEQSSTFEARDDDFVEMHGSPAAPAAAQSPPAYPQTAHTRAPATKIAGGAGGGGGNDERNSTHSTVLKAPPRKKSLTGETTTPLQIAVPRDTYIESVEENPKPI